LGKNQAGKKKWLRKKNMTEMPSARTKSPSQQNDWDAECVHEIAKSIKQKRLEKKPAEKEKNDWDAKCVLEIAKSMKQKNTWEKDFICLFQTFFLFSSFGLEGGVRPSCLMHTDLSVKRLTLLSSSEPKVVVDSNTFLLISFLTFMTD
jgi:hypothetical protein